MSDRTEATRVPRAAAAGPDTPADAEFQRDVLCHLDVVYRVAVGLSRDPHEAEDLVQETFLRAHRSFQRFELRSHGAKAWLLKILHNVFYSRRDQARRGPVQLDEIGPEDFAADAEVTPVIPNLVGDLDWDGFDEEIKAAVSSLSPEYRSVLLLWALADMSYKEIAEVLGCAIGTVMSRLSRAREQLNRTLGEYAQARGIRRRTEDDS